MKDVIQLGQNTIILIGTGHVLQESVDLVRSTILEVHPDYVAVELDPERLIALESEPREKPRFRDLMQGGIRMAILTSVLSYSQGKIGEETGVLPGAEMLEAVKTARETGATLKLIDRSAAVTVERLASEISLGDIVRIIFYMLVSSRVKLEIDEELVDDLTEELYRLSPAAYRVLIEERDHIMALNVEGLSGTVVVVTGAGHVKGIKRELIEKYKNSGKEED